MTYHIRRLTTYNQGSNGSSMAVPDYFIGRDEREFGKEKNAMEFNSKELAQLTVDSIDSRLIENSGNVRRSVRIREVGKK